MTDENERFCDGCGEPLPDDWNDCNEWKDRLEGHREWSAVPEYEGDDYDGELLDVEEIDEDEIIDELEAMDP